MTVAALDVLADIRRQGGDVKVIAPDRLRVLAPPALLSDFAARVRAVKADLLIALVAPKLPTDTRPAEWRARQAEALAFWRAFHPDDEAARIAWGELENRWHELYGERRPVWECVGCGDPIGDTITLTLGDGTRVHFDRLTCLLRYGERWRGTASRALAAMGLVPATGHEQC